jgi:hypothetical protein
VRSQIRRSYEDADEARSRHANLGLSRVQVRVSWAGVLIACITTVLAELKNLI